MKVVLISLISLAVVLGIVAYFAVFSGTQAIEPTVSSMSEQSSTPTLVLTAPSSSVFATTTAPTSPALLTTIPAFTSHFSAPYPVTWQEGNAQLDVTGASLEDNQLTLSVSVQLGPNGQCVPINLRMITDEEGNTAGPSAPDGGCDVSSSGQYASNVTFTVDPTSAPFLFTTGEPSSTFFEVATTTGNGLQVAVPEQSG